MVEVTKEKFNKIRNKIDCKVSFILGEIDTTRCYGKKGLFKDYFFAKRIGDKYFVLEHLIEKYEKL